MSKLDLHKLLTENGFEIIKRINSKEKFGCSLEEELTNTALRISEGGYKDIAIVPAYLINKKEKGYTHVLYAKLK